MAPDGIPRLGDDMDANWPPDSLVADGQEQNQGSFWIRELKARLQAFASVSFNLETGQLKQDVLGNLAVPTPDFAGEVLTISPAPNSTLKWVSPDLGVRTGQILLYGGAALPGAPGEYLNCDGQFKSNVTYAALFSVIGYLYGMQQGDASQFAVPDFRGFTPVGMTGPVGTAGTAPDATAWPLSRIFGSESVILTMDTYAPHTHGFYKMYADTFGVSATHVIQAGDGPSPQVPAALPDPASMQFIVSNVTLSWNDIFWYQGVWQGGVTNNSTDASYKTPHVTTDPMMMSFAHAQDAIPYSYRASLAHNNLFLSTGLKFIIKT